MAIISLVCGIIGLFVFITFCLFQLIAFGTLYDMYFFPLLVNLIILFYSVILLILALIFGIIELKKGKSHKKYGIAKAGFIIGLIGILVNIGLPVGYYAMSRYNEKSIYANHPRITILPYIRTVRYSHDFMREIIETETRDGYTVFIFNIALKYNVADTIILSELSDREPELRNFIKDYFSRWYADELILENREWFAKNIVDIINMRFFGTDIIKNMQFRKWVIKDVP